MKQLAVRKVIYCLLSEIFVTYNITDCRNRSQTTNFKAQISSTNTNFSLYLPVFRSVAGSAFASSFSNLPTVNVGMENGLS